MTDPMADLVDAEKGAVEVIGVECETVAAPAFEDPWQKKSTFFANLSIVGAEEAIDNAKRLLVLAEEAAMLETHATTRAEKLVDISDRWRHLISL